MTEFDDRRKQWRVGERKATNAEIRAARAAALKAHGGAIPCRIDSATVVAVDENAFVRLDASGNGIGLSRTRYGA